VLAPLEFRFPRPEMPACLDGIVMLANGEMVNGSLRDPPA